MSKEIKTPQIKAKADYWVLERDVSNAFNRLKAKFYNLIEASVSDKKQAEALKGLVKGFANDEYKICLENMRYSGKCIGILNWEDDQNIPFSSEPLENSKKGI